MIYSDEIIDELRDKIRARMSELRFFHTSEVEKMAVRIGQIYAPDKIGVIRAAALLHDVTKELSDEEHFDILSSHGIKPTSFDRLSPKTLHARTAELVIIDEFPEFADQEVLSCVRRHTTGHPDMNICDAIIYLADYIDMSRSFPDCVFLRNYFWDKKPQEMSSDKRQTHLWQTLLISFDMTLKALIDNKSPISRETVDTRNEIICRLNK